MAVMFPSGLRFQKPNVPDVPGPNSYSIPDSQTQSKKCGGFVEQADRFKDIEATDPSSNITTDTKKAPRNPLVPHTSKSLHPLSSSERYAMLLKKVEELESVHDEGKTAHQVELDRIKLELARYQKQLVRQADLIEKKREQADLEDIHIQELKKITLSYQTEIKELRTKLRISETERGKFESKSSETTELRRSLQALEIKRRQDLKKYDTRISDLEKVLAAEKIFHELTSSEYRELKGKVEYITKSSEAAEALVERHHADLLRAHEELSATQVEATTREIQFIEELELHRLLLRHASEIFAALVASTTQASIHDALKTRHLALQLQQSKSERKLANSEGQVVELAHLIRQVKEENLQLLRQLSDAHQEVAFYRSIELSSQDIQQDMQFNDFDIGGSHDLRYLEDAIVDRRSYQLTSSLYHLKSHVLAATCSVLNQDLEMTGEGARQRASHLSSTLASHQAAAHSLETVQKPCIALQEQLASALSSIETLTTTISSLEQQLTDKQDELQAAGSEYESAHRQERDAIQRLTTTIQKNRTAEDALRHEVTKLMVSLMEAERYQEAYFSLSDEVASLVTRNNIAEEEASQLSRFNAEILSHENPGQRIMYVDRIRRELAETKLKYARLSRTQETMASENDNLRHELDLYKSVVVPISKKPQTAMTRISRPTFVNMAQPTYCAIPESEPTSQKPEKFHVGST